MSALFKWTIILFFALFWRVETSKILGVFPLATGSHYNLYSQLMKGLAEAGHEVTMVSPYRFKEPPKRGKYRDLVLDGFAEDFERKFHAFSKT